jgi:hypothetical protein
MAIRSNIPNDMGSAAAFFSEFFTCEYMHARVQHLDKLVLGEAVCVNQECTARHARFLADACPRCCTAAAVQHSNTFPSRDLSPFPSR